MNEELEHRIRSAAHWMLERLGDMPTSGDALEHFGFTEHEWKTGFQAVYGMSAGRWYRKKRLSIAATLLRETDQTISVIAETVGYRNATKFAEAFRREFGSQPHIYRDSEPKAH